MNEKLEIHNFIEDYKEQEYEDIQWDIATRKEFNDLSGKPTEQVPEKGSYYNHQNIILRYMRQYDKIFSIHETGTGKTGSMINTAEYFRKNEPGRVKKVYVLEPGPNTVDDFKDQIIKLSGDKCYTNKRIEDIENDSVLKNNLTRLINKNYEVTTYQKFLKEDVDTRDIENYYNDCVFFLDEAHKLRNLSDSKGGELSEDQLDKIYDYIWKVLHIAKRVKVIISTATPMINNVRDFVPLLNLLLDHDNQLPLIKEESYYENLTLDQLEPYFRGKFTFVKFLDTGIDLNKKGICYENFKHNINVPIPDKSNKINTITKYIKDDNILNTKETEKNNLLKNQQLNKTKKAVLKSQITIFPLVMKGIQLETFRTVEKKKQDSFYREIKQSSIFVFPNGEYGNRGFSTYIEKNDYDEYSFKKKVIVKGQSYPSLNSIINPSDLTKTFNNLSQLSIKFTYFIQNELEKSKLKRPGCSFCYIDQVSGSGVILLGLIFERLGFENFTSTDSSIVNREGKIRESFPKKKRFAIFTGSAGNIRNSLKVFNNISNLHGEYIQIILASEVARDGINLESVIRGYIMTPGWHESGMHQAMSRFIRSTSHENLKNENMITLKEQGKKYKNYRLNIDIYRLASIKPEEEKILDTEKLSVDIRNYLKAEEKDIKIKRIIRYMKQCSFDAYLNYDRNVTEKEISYTKETDYTSKCIEIWKARGKPENDKRIGMAGNQGPSLEDYNYNTYNILYSEYIRSFVVKELGNILDKKTFIGIEEFIKIAYDKIELKFKNKTTYYAIYNILIDMEEKQKWFYGKRGIVIFNISFLGNNITQQRVSLNNYNNYIPTETDYIFQNNIDFNFEKNLSKEQDDNRLKEELKGKTSDYIIEYYARNQNYRDFKILIEDSLIKEYNNESTTLSKNIMKIFPNYFMLTEIPENWLVATEKALEPLQERSQGRNRAEGSTAGLRDLDLSKIEPGYKKPKTYIHFYRESDKTGFSITSILEGKERKIRILEDNKFRDTTITENFVYTYIFDKMYENIMEKYKKSKYYGSFIYRGGEQEKIYEKRKREFFRIIDSTNPRNKGRVCSNNNSDVLQNVLKYLDKEKKHKDIYTGKINKNKICEIIKDLFIKKDLLFISL